MENLDIFCEGENFIGITADENSKYINEWYNLFNSEYITRYLDHGFYPNTKSSQLEFIKKTNTHNDRLILLVLSKKTNEFLGTMSLSSINFLKRSCQFGLVLDNRRFKGDDLFIPLEVCSFLISHAFDKLGMLRVWGGQAYPGLKKWNKRVINIHPSLLPAFKGINPQERALKYNVKFSGCTIHFVNGEIDGGEIIDQSIVRVDKNETVKSLKKKILIEEHKLYINVLENIIQKES